MSDELKGLVKGLSQEEYAGAPGWRASSILNMRRSPMYFEHCLDHPQRETEDMKFGSSVHSWILECKPVAIWGSQPEHKTRRGKAWEDFQNSNLGKLIVTREEWEHMKSMFDSLMRYYPAAKYLYPSGINGDSEISMFWNDPASGRPMKARPDKIIKGKPYDILINLKTCRSCTPYHFGAAAYKLGYHISAAHYISGYRAITGREAKYKWIAVEKKPPYECAVYRATPDVITQGGEDLDALLKRIGECERSNVWPPEIEDETDLMLPTYAYSDDLPGFVDEEE